MAELKINVSDELAAKLQPFMDHLAEILEIGFREFEPKQSLLYDEIIEFLASGPSSREILNLKPSQAANERVSELLDKNNSGTLTRKESVELDFYQELNHLMTLIKLRVRQKLN